ncbi:MAG: hypothetical protein ABFD98_11435 [Syntrophobacteraceae bacterium]|nr:hypothetical protein [Desulfobacteraceae bacterium]
MRLRRVAIAVLVPIFAAQSWVAQRPWRNQLDLYAYAVDVEPLSARLHTYYGMNLLSRGEVLPAAWQFMARVYILEEFPGRVDPAPLYHLEQMPVQQRLLEGPSLLAPEDPCRFLDDYLGFLQARTPHLSRYVREVLSRRYAECGRSLNGQDSEQSGPDGEKSGIADSNGRP